MAAAGAGDSPTSTSFAAASPLLGNDSFGRVQASAPPTDRRLMTPDVRDLMVREYVTEGAFGSVYHGLWMVYGLVVPVAIKEMRMENAKNKKALEAIKSEGLILACAPALLPPPPRPLAAAPSSLAPVFHPSPPPCFPRS